MKCSLIAFSAGEVISCVLTWIFDVAEDGLIVIFSGGGG